MMLIIIFASLNFWIWHIYRYDFAISIILLLLSILYSLWIKKCKYGFFVFILFFMSCYYFVTKSQFENFVFLSEQQRIVQLKRMNEYPPTYVDMDGKMIAIPLAHWLEQRSESIIFYNSSQKLFELLDINYYFFANHPRERSGIREFEKFPYFHLPFFFAGLYFILKKYRSKKFIILFLSSILLSLFLKFPQDLGPFILYPFIASSTMVGMDESFAYIKRRHKKYRNLYFLIFTVIFILIFIQLYSYEFA